MTFSRTGFRRGSARKPMVRGKAMAQGSSLASISKRKLAALAEAGITNPSTTFVSVAPKMAAKPAVKRPTDTGPDSDTVDLVLERDQYSCVVCGYGVGDRRGTDWSIHHRVRRSQGLDNSPRNLITVCGNGTQGDHAAIHARPKWARETGGWLLKGTDDPASMPVLIERGARWAPLLPDGRAVTVPAPDWAVAA